MRIYARIGTVLSVLSLVLAQPQSSEGQTVSQIIDDYLEQNASRLEGVSDVLLVQSVMGMTSEMYMEKVEVDGNPVLQPRLLRAQGMTMPLEPGSDNASFTDGSSYLVELADRAELGGTEVVDGQQTTIIEVDDLSGFSFSPPTQGGAQDPMELRSLRMFVDTEDWVIRRMEMAADVTTPDGTSEATVLVDMSDFREVEGMIHPFRVVTSTTGLGGMVSAEDMEQARRSLEQLEEQLANMPEQQRQMVEQMMGDQVESLMEMLASGSLTIEIEVQEIRVNEGPPEA